MTTQSTTTSLAATDGSVRVVVYDQERSFRVDESAASITRLTNTDAGHLAPDPVRKADKSAGLAAASARLFLNTIATFVLVISVGLSVLATLPLLGGYRSVVVSSGSMAPAIHTADVVVTESPIPDRIQVGSVIDYQTSQGTRIHRVVEVTASGYITQGDANPTPDAESPSREDVIGVGVYVVPFVGLPRVWLEQQSWWKLGLAFLILAGSGFFARQAWLFPLSEFQVRTSIRTHTSERRFAR